MHPLGQGVGAVADGLLAEGGHVGVGGLGQREVGGVAQALDEVRGGGGERDREGQVIDLRQPGELGVLLGGVALDELVEVAGQLGVGLQGAVAPGLDEGVGGDRRAV